MCNSCNKKQMDKMYNPSESDKRIYENWEKNGYFHAEPDSSKKPFSIVMAPPNITGQLHLGHALDNTLPDIMIRWRRMQGYQACFVPGTDHASIATEAKIVEAMRKEGLTKDDMTREQFLERAWNWRKEYGTRIVTQLRRLGISCDWERERFTMDPGLSKAVRRVFVSLYEKGLIYRGERMVNWCSKCLTSISDAEVEYEDQESTLTYVRYPYTDGSGYVVVATSRPETMLGDMAVAVNPDDERYKSFIGKMVKLPLTDREIPIIADDYVKTEFGTGAVKITPAHDPNDLAVGQRHNLTILDTFTPDGKLYSQAGKYAGMELKEARKAMVEDLKALGLIEKIEPYKHSVGTCYRCSMTVEPKVSTQWFVKMEPLARPAIEAVRNGDTEFIPERFSKIYYNWMENIRDWCISRQLWWGHRIPAWYCQDCGETIVAEDDPQECPHCHSKNIVQDEDTLDTWFSSALWPFAVFGWPEKTKDLEYFYPTDVLVPGYDIIFFWVARMIFSALEQTGEVPFKHVLLHGIVRDSQGRKMSKSLGNGIDPLEVIEKYGADALRYSVVQGTSPGKDMRYQEEKLEAGRAFVTKIWNATRFLINNFPENFDATKFDPAKLQREDKWILSRLNHVVSEVTTNLEKFELGIALSKIYSFIWEEFCDWYIEMVKYRLHDESCPTRQEALYVLNKVLTASLKMLHPYMPFATEEMYLHLPDSEETIMKSKWPEVDETMIDDVLEEEMSGLMDAIRQIRNLRLKLNVPYSQKAQLIVIPSKSSTAEIFESGLGYLQRMASVSTLTITDKREEVDKNAVTAVFSGGDIFIPLNELVDTEKEKARLLKEKERLMSEVARQEGKLSNESFVSKAPAAVVEGERKKLEIAKSMLSSVCERLETL